jgi:hypothetical protein
MSIEGLNSLLVIDGFLCMQAPLMSEQENNDPGCQRSYSQEPLLQVRFLCLGNSALAAMHA